MHLPGPLRAAVGLVASAADEARHLPDRAIELPMLAVSTALQASLRAQQRYARLAARGDAVLNRRPTTDEPPAWATFDDPVTADEIRRTSGAGPNGFGPAGVEAARMLDELFGVGDPAASQGSGAAVVADVADLDEARQAASGKGSAPEAAPQKATTKAATPRAAAKKTATKPTATKPPAKKIAAKKTAAKKAAAKTPAAGKAAASTSSATTPTATKSAARGKTVNQPRHTAPSAFDSAGDAGADD